MSRGTPAPVPVADTSAAGTGAVSRVPLLALCITEITSWGVLYYAFPVLGRDITRDTGWSTAAITAAFSASLVVAALAGVPVGRVGPARPPRPDDRRLGARRARRLRRGRRAHSLDVRRSLASGRRRDVRGAYDDIAVVGTEYYAEVPRHWLVDPRTMALRGSVVYPFPVSGPPLSAGKDAWCTVSKDQTALHLWDLPHRE